MLPAMRTINNTDQSTNANPSAQPAPSSAQMPSSVLVACFVMPVDQAESLIAVLRSIATSAPNGSAFPSAPANPTSKTESVWLSHSEAARYLGIATSTLYRYAEQARLESRKLGNRLEYRQSSLDRFKENQIRPPRRLRSHGIISPTLGSGN